MAQRHIRIDDQITIGNEPVKIISGAVHYGRIHPSYWRDRLEKIKAMGCNTIETYVPWNIHEPEKGTFQFEGQYDLIRFIELIHELDLYLILRASPYICAEWEFGGLPYWLLKDRNMRVRSLYQPYMNHLEAFFEVLIPKVSEYQIHKGGPIILVQVENEYGYFSNEKTYTRKLADIYKRYGIEVPLVTSDSTRESIMMSGEISDVAMPTINCGFDLKERSQILDKVNPGKPRIAMEFWSGWFNIWGSPSQEVRDVNQINKDLKEMLEIGHVNLYMAHGGTNFGFMNGANYYEKVDEEGNFVEEYAPATTSYDYGAPISENGELKDRYWTYKQTIQDITGVETVLPEELKKTKKMAYGDLQVQEKVALSETLEDLANPVFSHYPMTMEELDQDFGYVLYRSKLGDKDWSQTIKLLGTKDRAQVFLNDQLQFSAYLKTFYKKQSIQLEKGTENTLDILVENMGRVNFGPYLDDQRKGITKAVMLDEYQHTGWYHYTLSLKEIEKVDFKKDYKEQVPAFYKSSLLIEDVADTYITLPGWGKGVIFINGFNIGRFWENGPQESYYIPSPLLQEGENEVIIFETEGKVTDKVTFIKNLIS